MDRHRGEDRSGGEGGGRHSRVPTRWSDGPMELPPQQQQQQHRQPGGYPRGGGHGGFSERHHPYRGGPSHDYPSGGGRGPGFRPAPGGYGGGDSDPQLQMSGGPRRVGGGGYFGSGRGEAPNSSDGGKFAKLFIGSVPRTATEQDIRPLFEEHGHVIEVALIKDKRTGQQQGCCFIKYANSEDADRAIRLLHNQYTLPGGVGPIQVRYADGERERLGAVEHKLFVGSLNKQATEKEVEEIFSPYGRVEDVYIMRDDLKQSRGCGFVKFSNREMASAAINALNGVYMMRGCEQPLIVRFADPKRPRPGESRGGPAFGGPGLGPRSQAPPIPRATPNMDEPMTGRFPLNSWNQMSPESSVPASHGFSSSLHSKSGIAATSSTTGFSQGVQLPPIGLQISPLQNRKMSPQNLPSQLHHNPPTSSYPQMPTLQSPMQQITHGQIPHPGGSTSLPQTLHSQQLIGLGGQFSSSQQQGVSAPPLQLPFNIPHVASAGANPQQCPPGAVSHLLQQPIQQSPAQMIFPQQAQNAPSNFQSSQQTFSQLQQQQMQFIQPSNLSQQQSSQAIKQQAHPANLAATLAVAQPPSSPSLQLTGKAAAPLTCSWTEHTSPEGFKYYYNSATKESKWEKPEELTLFEQQQQPQQQQQKFTTQHIQSSQLQLPQNQSNRPVSQTQQPQVQLQLRQQGQLQQLHPLPYQASGALGNQNIQDVGYQLQGATNGIDLQKYNMQGSQSAQEWMWKNKTAGA